MSIRNELKNALSDYELFYITRGSKERECIVYNYMSEVKTVSDGKIESYEYTILLNVIVNSKIDLTNETIREKLMENKFNKIKIQKPVSEEAGFFNTAIQCKKVIFKEDL